VLAKKVGPVYLKTHIDSAYIFKMTQQIYVIFGIFNSIWFWKHNIQNSPNLSIKVVTIH